MELHPAWRRELRDAPACLTQLRQPQRHFPQSRPVVEPHAADPPPLPGGAATLARGRPRQAALVRVVILGAIGREKGFDVLLACAQDVAERGLGLRFVVIGQTRDDEALFATGRVEVTGPYREGEAAGLIARARADAAFVPTIVPETWCFALGEIFAAGLPALAFDIGAQAERIRRTRRGWLLPLGAPAALVNDVLQQPPRLAAAPRVMHRNDDAGSARFTHPRSGSVA